MKRHEAYMKEKIAESNERAGKEAYGNVVVDMVNQPPHYTYGDIECIDAIRSALGPEGFAAFCRGNIIKYNWRCDHKNGLQDLEKAAWYLNKLLKVQGETK